MVGVARWIVVDLDRRRPVCAAVARTYEQNVGEVVKPGSGRKRIGERVVTVVPRDEDLAALAPFAHRKARQLKDADRTLQNAVVAVARAINVMHLGGRTEGRTIIGR